MMSKWLPCLIIACWACAFGAAQGQLSFVQTTRAVQPKIVKIYGAGGIRGLEPYQSGFLVSAEGHVATAFSYVLDTDLIGVTLNDGARYDAELLGTDPRLEIAVLKIDASDLEHFDLTAATKLNVGQRVLAFSNLYGIATGNEPASVQHGHVSAVWNLAARKGTFQSPYNGPVYVLDAMTNNAGAAGGTLTDQSGNLAGMLGKELRSAQSNMWLNYALPIEEISDSVSAIISGVERVGESASAVANEHATDSPWTIVDLGMRFVPNLMHKTPPYVESVIPDSPAGRVGIQTDDLVVYVNQQVVRSQKQLFALLRKVDCADPVSLVVLRNQQLVPVQLRPDE